MNVTVSKHTREAKEKYSASEESNNFANQFDFAPKEIDIKDKSKETTKNIKTGAKVQPLNQLKRLGTKTPTWTRHTNAHIDLVKTN